MASDIPRVEIIGAPDPFGRLRPQAVTEHPLDPGQGVVLVAPYRGVEWDARVARPAFDRPDAVILDVDWSTVRRTAIWIRPASGYTSHGWPYGNPTGPEPERVSRCSGLATCPTCQSEATDGQR